VNVLSASCAARSCSDAAAAGRRRRHDHRREHVDVDAEQALGSLAGHRVGDDGAPVAALGEVAGVADAAHQLRPGLPNASRVPAELGRLTREAVAG
jgi:hypothetical protein